MSFDQIRLDRSFNQSRNIFDKYAYTTADSIEDVSTPGYFVQSRFASNDWAGGIIECQCSDGFVIGKISQDGTSIEVLFSTFSNNFRVVSISSDYTTTGNEIIVCTNSGPILVTLNPDALDSEQVYIKRTDGDVRAVGQVDGSTNLDIGAPRNSPHLVYANAITGWSII